MARICRRRGLHLAAACFYRETLELAGGGQSLRFDEILDPAGAATLVGCGRGDGSANLTADEKAQWHAWARELLLGGLESHGAAKPRTGRDLRLVVQALGHAPALDEVRGDGRPHREAWRAFWKTVGEIAARLP